MPGTHPKIFLLRLMAAALAAFGIPTLLGPSDDRYRMFAVSLAVLVILGGLIRSRTKEGGLTGELATAALALLMLAPAVGVRAGRVADAIFVATHIAPHEALYQLPAIAQGVPNASGPLLAGAGVAMLVVAGRLGAVYAGIAFGGALAAWIGQTLAVEAGNAMLVERFEDAVLIAQAMRFVGLTVIIGGIAGFPFYQRGKVEWRRAMRQVIHDERMAIEQARRDEEIARVKAAHDELKAREAAAEAKRAKEAEEAEAANQGVTIEDLADTDAQTESLDKTTKTEAPNSEDPPNPMDDEVDGEGGGFGEEDAEIEEDADDDQEAETSDDGDSINGSDSDSDANPDEPSEAEPELPELELEPRFDIESPIVIEVSPEESDPNSALAPKAIKRFQQQIVGLMIIAGLAAGWTATPPWFEVLNALPDPGTDVAVPVTEPGLSIARTPLDPFHKEFSQHLERRGHPRLHSAPWSCLNDTANYGRRYGTQDRAIEVIAIPADTPMVDLKDAIAAMRKRGVYRMGLTGRADPPYGPLGALFAWPAVQLLLDRPPRAAQWLRLKPRSIEELPLLPGDGQPRSCVLLIDEDVKANHLYNTVRSLSSTYGDKRCELGIALVLPSDGTTTNANPAWRGCP